MSDFSDAVMIALLPVDDSWCKLDLPHLTLVYAGLTSDLKPTDFNELAKDAAMLAMLTPRFSLKVMSKEIFGSDEKVDAYKLQANPAIWAMRRAVEHWNASKHPFNPHVTIGPVGSGVPVEPPRYIHFNQIMVGWGEERMTFWLSRA